MKKVGGVGLVCGACLWGLSVSSLTKTCLCQLSLPVVCYWILTNSQGCLCFLLGIHRYVWVDVGALVTYAVEGFTLSLAAFGSGSGRGNFDWVALVSLACAMGVRLRSWA